MSDYELSVHGVRLTTPDLKFFSYFGFKEDELALLDSLRVSDLKGEPGYITEIYGIRTRIASLWPDMKAYDGAVAGLPIPCNWHWEATEWLAIMRSVLQAKDRYRIMELGAGWGPAAVAGAALARTHGIADIKSTALEGDNLHYENVRLHFQDNGFDPDQHVVMNAAVGKKSGVAKWPVTDDNATHYGNRPMDAVDDKGRKQEARDYLERENVRTRDVKVVSFRSLLLAERVWDLLHIDIQGGEFEICSDAIKLLNERVGRICLGVHSRKLDGDLWDLFWRNGWWQEGETPTRFHFNPLVKSAEAMTCVDGTQVWRNPRLRDELHAPKP